MRETANSPWERQQGESQEAFEAFSKYLDMGENRTLREVRQELGKSDTIIERWSRHWKWVDRIVEWEKHLRKKALARLERISLEENEIEQERQLKLRKGLGTLLETRIEAKQTGPQLRTISMKDSNGNPVEVKLADLAVPELYELYEKVDGRIRNPFGVEKLGIFRLTEEQLAASEACERLGSPRLIEAGPAQVVDTDTECAA